MSSMAEVEKFMTKVRGCLGDGYNIIYGGLERVEVQKLSLVDGSVDSSILVTYEQIFYDIDPVSDIVNVARNS